MSTEFLTNQSIQRTGITRSGYAATSPGSCPLSGTMSHHLLPSPHGSSLQIGDPDVPREHVDQRSPKTGERHEVRLLSAALSLHLFD